jgi:hypothetical protein
MTQDRRHPLLFAAAIWLLLVVAGLSLLSSYESKAGSNSAAPPQWPTTSKLPHENAYTLVLAVHPQCPCTEATLSELALLLARCPEMGADLLFVQPKGFNESWAQSNLWKRAEAMPRVRLFLDPEGTQAALFDAKTSGQASLYSRQGELLFQGGLTAARGHAGDNLGVDSIVAITQHHAPVTRRTSVFGCSLVDEPTRTSTR